MTPQRRLKQILAIIALVIIAGLYIVTLILALSGNEYTKNLFTASIITTIAVPLFMYVVYWVYNLVKGQAEDARNQAGESEEPEQPSADSEQSPDDPKDN